MKTLEPFEELREALIDAGGESLRICYQCGTCTATCPWNLVITFPVRKMIHQAQLGLAEYEGEEIWFCSTCRACMERCPRGVKIIDVMRAMRRLSVEAGGIPKSLRGAMTSTRGEGNPWLSERVKRTDWAKDLNIPQFTKETEFLYFACCNHCYDPRNIKVAIAQVSILNTAGVSFGIIGEKESCCAEAMRKVGAEDIFTELAQSNINLFHQNGVKRIITTSPHCYHTFVNEYKELDSSFEVKHIVQLVNELLKEGKLKIEKELKTKVAYHDPCYLGRHNLIYDEPREVLKSILGVELVELPDNRETSICCGGGGGGIWLERKKGERICDIRVEQALQVGAEILATCCPYCISNFEDSVKTLGKEDVLKIYDISELVNQVS